ncbi:fungal-specific transcription factor domain-containing protein [Roridomyces roridus]|uniref:Fungal-specific transcription factor domain-containing protein n=1 Tax=Roridomyces roridus TaxID=1738132 RepID=A0AAD7FFV6_9AGAR|nr:fungal-specific transcription factor domain-containing protein [Roridomyces roridus]
MHANSRLNAAEAREVSCAECRRLKIKCDKQIPCQSCVRRGCSALCPNGALATGQGTRFVLAATEHLHRKIARMGERIRLLEDALTTLHARQSDPDGAAHPLMVNGEDFAIPDDPASLRAEGSWESLEGPEGRTPTTSGTGSGDVIDAFGTLSISDHGISRFFGPTGGSESLLLSNVSDTASVTSASASDSPSSLSLSRSSQSLSPASTHASSPASPSRSAPSSYMSNSGASPPHPTSVSPSTLFSSASFPLTALGPPQAVHALVTSHLPRRAHARRLIESYFTHLGWLFHNVTPGQVREMSHAIYTAYGRPDDDDELWEGSGGNGPDTADVAADVEEGDNTREEEDYTGPHDLALLFMVLAAGAIVLPAPPGVPDDDPVAHAHRQRVAAEGEHLHQIARAALALQPVLEKPSLVTIQTLHMLSIYTGLDSGPSGKKGEDAEPSMEMTWSLLTLAAHLSQTIGLHRDSARWGLSPKMVQRRRILFWDLFVGDVWTSLNTGRPPSFSLAYIDCGFPKSSDYKDRDGNFEVWNFRFAAECVADVTSRTLTAEAPTYATIMELDRKVREFPLPSLLEDPKAADDVGLSMQRCVLEHIRETVLMYIHRSFFAQAIIEQPANPLKSTYAPSFLAAYRASGTIIKSVRDQFTSMPNSCARFWTMWTYAFSAAVVFGTVVTRGPRSPLASSAMTELDNACVLFSKASVYSRRATRALTILTKLSEKARHALAAAQNDPSPLGADNGGLLWKMSGVLGPTGLPVKVKEEADDELSIFAGHTRFVSGPVQRGGASSVGFPLVQPQQQHPITESRQQSRPEPTPMQGREDISHYGSFDARQFAGGHFEPPPPVPRQRQHSMPSSSNYRPQRPSVDADSSRWEQQQQHYSEYATSPMDGREMQQPPQSHGFYSSDGMMHQPAPSQPYAGWPVQAYNNIDAERAQHQHQHQHRMQQQQQQQQFRDRDPHYRPQQQHQYHHEPPPPPPAEMYSTHPQHQHHPAQAAFQAHNAELANLGLAARDSRLDERWSTFMEDSGYLEGI